MPTENKNWLSFPPRVAYEELLNLSLNEDLGSGGDISSEYTISPDHVSRAYCVAREDGVLAGAPIIRATYEAISKDLAIEEFIEEGASLHKGDVIAMVHGPTKDILAGERVALNFLCRLSGIATLSSRYVNALHGTNSKIVCTRKTTPGHRALEKYAVRAGGALNHRFSLDGAVMIKDNHIVAAGGVREAVKRARSRAGLLTKVEVEVESIEGVREALEAGADVIMLDNMALSMLRESVKLINGRAITEASGGVNLDNVRDIAASGVDFISVGALTHSAKALDIGLDFEK